MKKLLLTLLLPLLWTISFAQNKVAAEKLVDEGIKLHDKEDYAGALAQYNKALELDKDNLYALAEIAYTLLSQEKYEEVVKTSERAVKAHKTGEELKTLYVTYGNALDMLNRSKESVAVYDLGIQQFPDEQMLYFNKGVTLRGMEKNDEALVALQKAALLNPSHPGTHNAIALVSKDKENRLSAILAYWRFLSLEPLGKRAEGIAPKVIELMVNGFTKDSDKNVTIVAYFGMPGKADTHVQDFTRKFDLICDALKAGKNSNSGFFWDYYAPYFLELKAKGYSELFARMALATLDPAETQRWFKENENKLNEFIKWSGDYKWKTN